MSNSLPPNDLLGVDVSHHQGIIDWSIASQNVDFAFVRISDGLKRDRRFDRNWEETREHSVRRGVYQYFRASKPVREQAQMIVDSCMDSDIPPALDLEDLDGCCPQHVLETAREWLLAVEEQFGCKPLVYTCPGFVGQLGKAPAWLADYPLWLADYTPPATIPGPWTEYAIWQTSGSARVEGFATNVDVNRIQMRGLLYERALASMMRVLSSLT